MQVEPALPSGDGCGPTPASKAEREPHWDAVRALLMMLGIPFHATHPYRVDERWIISSADHSLVLTYVMQALHLFRMQGFFIIAGYFAAMLLARRDPETWWRSRVRRLGIPLFFGLVILVPVMHLGTELLNEPAGGTLERWIDDESSLDRSTTEHLWFLIILLYYSAAATAAAMLMPGRRFPSIAPKLDGVINRHGCAALLLGAVAIGLFTFLGEKIETRVLSARSFTADVLSLRFAWLYAPYFFFGLIIQRASGLQSVVTRWMAPLTLIGISSAVLVLISRASMPWIGVCVLRALAAVGLSQFVIACAYAAFNRERAWIKEIVDASFAIYLLHLPVLVAMFWLVEYLPLPVTVRFVLLSASTLMVCWGAWLLIKPRPFLQLIFSGMPLSQRG